MSCRILGLRNNYGPTTNEMEETLVQLLEHISTEQEKTLTCIFNTVLNNPLSVAENSSLMQCLTQLDQLKETDSNQYISLTSKIALEIISARDMLVSDESLKIGTALTLATVPGIIMERWPTLFPPNNASTTLQEWCDNLLSEECNQEDFDSFLGAAFDQYFPDHEQWDQFSIDIIKQPSLTLSFPKKPRQTVLEIKFHSDFIMQDVNALLEGKFTQTVKRIASKRPPNYLVLRFNKSQGDLAYRFLEKFIERLKTTSYDNPALIFAAIHYLHRLRAFYPEECAKALKINEAIFCLFVGPSISIIEAIEKNYLNFIQTLKLDKQQYNRALLLTANFNNRKSIQQIKDVGLINKVLELLLKAPQYSHLASAVVIYEVHKSLLGDNSEKWAQRLRLKMLELKLVKEKAEDIMEAILLKCEDSYAFFLQSARTFLQRSMNKDGVLKMGCMKRMLYCIPNGCQKFPKLKDEIERTMSTWLDLTIQLDINVTQYESEGSYKKLVDQYMKSVNQFEERAAVFFKKKIISEQLKNTIKETLVPRESVIIIYKK